MTEFFFLRTPVEFIRFADHLKPLFGCAGSISLSFAAKKAYFI